jgi:hypothetical protein
MLLKYLGFPATGNLTVAIVQLTLQPYLYLLLSPVFPAGFSLFYAIVYLRLSLQICIDNI